VLRAASWGGPAGSRLRCSAGVGRTQPARAIPASTMTPAPNSIRRSLQTAGVDGEDAADPRGEAQGETGDEVDDGQDGGPLMRRRQRDGTAPPPARTSRVSPPRTGQSSSRSSPGRAPGPANRRTRRAPIRPNSLYTAFGRSGIARPDGPGLRRPLPGQVGRHRRRGRHALPLTAARSAPVQGGRRAVHPMVVPRNGQDGEHDADRSRPH